MVNIHIIMYYYIVIIVIIYYNHENGILSIRYSYHRNVIYISHKFLAVYITIYNY